jgi:outer membrane receptor protein involved in Fe transport
MVRGDHRLTDRNAIAIRYFQGTGTFVLPFPNFNTVAGFDADLHYESRNANITDTWNISPSTVNQSRFAYARSLGLLPPENNLQSPRFDILDGSLASFGALEFFTQGRIFNVYQGNDVVSREMGRHQLKFGFDARYIQDNSVNQTNDRGLYSFQSISTFLNGQPASLTQAFGPSELGFREHLYSAFAQDDYRIRPTLTINIGLRWEYQSDIDEAHGLTSVLDPTRSGSVGLAGTGPLGSFYVGNPATKSNPANFAPRLGFAWNPNSGKLVVRGGYGIYYDSFNFTALSEARTNPPLNYTFNLGDFSGANNFDALLAGTAPFIVDSRQQVGSFGNLTDLGTITTVNRNMRNPYVQQWDLLFDYQLARSAIASIGYVGAQGTHLQAFIPINPIAPADRPAPATSAADEAARINEFEAAVAAENGPGDNRVDPRFDQVNIVTDAASSTFHSLQLNLRTSMRYGLTLQAAYTYSKSIDDSSSSNPNQENFDAGVQQNVNNLALERGPSNYDIPNRIVVTGVWALPFVKAGESQLAKLLMKGWTFSSINTWQSGIPANIYAGPVTVPGAAPIADVNIDGVFTPAGADNTRAHCDSGGADFQLGNAASIAAQTRYTQPLLGNDGTCGRNRFRLNSLTAFNWAFSKDFRLTEKGLMGSGPWSIEFRAEVYNMFNHPNLSISSAAELTLTNPAFGLYDTAGAPHTMQLAMKLVF